jgi:tetratricopeptide (TPR) repeat protein
MADAIAHYEAAVRINPDLPEAHYVLGLALLKLSGRTPEAISHLESVVRLRPDSEAQQLLDRLRATP